MASAFLSRGILDSGGSLVPDGVVAADDDDDVEATVGIGLGHGLL